jgi:hypothetical protein
MLGFTTIGAAPVGARLMAAPDIVLPPPVGEVDVSKIPAGRKVVFGGGLRTVIFTGGTRTVIFSGGTRTVRF